MQIKLLGLEGGVNSAALVRYVLKERRLSLKYGKCVSKIWHLLFIRYQVPCINTLGQCRWLHYDIPNSLDMNFRFNNRMPRTSFGVLVNVLETKRTHPFTFTNRSNWPLIPIAIQIHMMLFRLGNYGNGAGFKETPDKYQLGVGTVLNARNRVVRHSFN